MPLLDVPFHGPVRHASTVVTPFYSACCVSTNDRLGADLRRAVNEGNEGDARAILRRAKALYADPVFEGHCAVALHCATRRNDGMSQSLIDKGIPLGGMVTLTCPTASSSVPAIMFMAGISLGHRGYTVQPESMSLEAYDGACADIVRALVDAGARPDARAVPSNETALHACARAGLVQTLLVLLPICDANAVSRADETPLLVACTHGGVGAAAALLKGGAVAASTCSWVSCVTPTLAAVRSGSLPTLQLVLDADVQDARRSPLALLAACRSGRLDMVQSLLRAGAQPRAVGPVGKTAYQVSVSRAEIFLALWSADGGPLDISTDTGETLAHMAVREQSVLVLEAIIASGAVTNRANSNGHTPLDLACYLRNGALISLLVH